LQRNSQDIFRNIDDSDGYRVNFDAELQQFLSLNQIAKYLGLTDRTLQRQLANEKTTFQILLSESRQAKAKTLLKK
jgi:AraC-like DNA-binding protein